MADRYALLIGINYLGTDYPLQGCWNDVFNMKNYLLTKRGYVENNMEIMTDEPVYKNTAKFPTRENMIAAFDRLIAKASLSGVKELFLHYSGHGGYLRDRSVDERDGRDECIFPVDLNMIIDDDLRKYLVDKLPANVKLRCVFDCCNSGTGIDLNYRYVPFVGLYRESRGVDNKDVVFISGSRDDQVSADAYINNSPQGALTALLLEILKTPQPNWKWPDFIKILQYRIRQAGFSQVPQLSFCNRYDVSKTVDI